MDDQVVGPNKSSDRLILVVGYGNPLRQDDGIGQHVAKTIADWNLPQVEAIAVHQLTPELAEYLIRAEMAIFVDACPVATSPDVSIQPLELAESGMTSGHSCDPQSLLAMTQALYGYHPRSWWVMVPGVHFELGECFSPIADQGIKTALQQIKQFIQTARREPCMKLE